MQLLHNSKLLFASTRPLTTYPAALLFFSIGFVFSAYEFTLHLLVAILSLLFVPIIIFGVNDVFDRETDARNKRKRSLMEGYTLSKRDQSIILKSAAFVSLFGAIIALFVSIDFFVVFIAGVALAYAYSAPPLRLKSRPIIDSAANALGIAGAMLLGFTVYGSFADFPAKLYLASLAGISVHALGAAMDYSADKKSGITTIATYFGIRIAALYSAIAMLIILLFSGIESRPVNALFVVWLIASLLIVIIPREAFVHTFIRYSFFVSILALLAFFVQTFLKLF